MAPDSHKAPSQTRAMTRSPLCLKRGVSFTNEPRPSHRRAKERWTAEMEQRLQYLERLVEEHQKAWSAGQEDYVHEVEKLHDAKRKFDRFSRRRIKDQKREGKRFMRALSQGSDEDDESQAESQLKIGGLIKRVKSLQTSDDSEAQKSITGLLGRIGNKKRSKSYQST
ncbi:MAG: hypothetical protein M1833_002742 [Piccolia ochrophora]|nr:MAG: hypothetical protein M1833_002742 [Piccolia ochrophora]